MGPLLTLLRRLVGVADRLPRRRVPVASTAEAETTIFLVLRWMRAPLIVLIVIFAISVLGLTLIPGVDSDGHVVYLSFFDAFYFMSYTATTIGFGEIPYAFTDGQRLWVTVTIYLTVIGWAYAISAMLALLQNNAFRAAVALQRFTRKVKALREPFLLVVGHGRTGQLTCELLDEVGKRVVVLDVVGARVDALDLATYRSDVPGLVADVRDPTKLALAGLANPFCSTVLALTDDDEANLAATMAAALLRPDVHVIARCSSAPIAARMKAFGDPSVVNPFDRYGDQLRIAMRAPASYQLIMWFQAGPGAPLPELSRLPAEGRWIVCSDGRFGREFTADLRAEGLDVIVIEETPTPGKEHGADIIGPGYDPEVLHHAGIDEAVGFVAGTSSDTANLSMLATARKLNPSLFTIGRRNRPEDEELFAAIHPDALLVLSDVVAHEVFAQVSTPLLWRFLNEVPHRSDTWARSLIARLATTCGPRLAEVWKVRLDRVEAPAITGWLASGSCTVGELLRDPDGRDDRLAITVLMVLRGDVALMAPSDETVLEPDDHLLLTGNATARRGLDTTLITPSVCTYVRTGHYVPVGWLWQRLIGNRM